VMPPLEGRSPDRVAAAPCSSVTHEASERAMRWERSPAYLRREMRRAR
jgi:hypothetical protein